MLKKCTISNKKKIIIGGVFLALAVVAYVLAAISDWVAEYIFARGIYRLLSTILNLVTGLAPFSIVEIIVVLLPIIVVIRIAFLVGRLIKGKERSKIIKCALSNIFLTIGMIAFLYMFLCGVNYHRYSFARINDIQIVKHSDEQLYEMCLDIAKRMNEARALMDERDGVAYYHMNEYELADVMESEFERTAQSYECLNGHVVHSKPLLTSYIFSCFETTGIYSPFTVEANVNVHIPQFHIPYTMAHEMAHVSGFMREDEANYIAYLVCTGSDNPGIVYSGLSLAFTHAANKLYECNQEYYYTLWETLDATVVADRQAAGKYWSEFEGTKIAQAGSKINDSYLKANSQNDGTKSYGRMVDLLLSTYFD